LNFPTPSTCQNVASPTGAHFQDLSNDEFFSNFASACRQCFSFSPVVILVFFHHLPTPTSRSYLFTPVNDRMVIIIKQSRNRIQYRRLVSLMTFFWRIFITIIHLIDFYRADFADSITDISFGCYAARERAQYYNP